MLSDVLSRCKGCVIAHLILRSLPYNEQVVDVMLQCLPFISVTNVFVEGVVSGHDQVHRVLKVMPGLREVLFRNDAAHPNAASVLSVCMARTVSNATLKFAADVTEAEILDIAFNNNSAGITREMGHYLSASRGRRNECRSLRFGIGSIPTDPTDAKYGRYVVDRDDRAAMYKFEKVGQTDLPFAILVGLNGSNRFYLKVLQGDAHDLCSSLDAARKIPAGKMTR